VTGSGGRVFIAGGGIAGLETLLALRAFSDGAIDVTLAAPEPDFTYRPLLVREPFGEDPADRISLGPALEEVGAEFVLAALDRVDADACEARLDDGTTVPYEAAVICTGAALMPALRGALTLWAGADSPFLPALLEQLSAERHPEIDFVVPPGTAWALPLYEVALMSATRLRRIGAERPRLRILTPEPAPLSVFGSFASEAVGDVLEGAGIEVVLDAFVHEDAEGSLSITPGAAEVADTCIALPLIEGRPVAGVPANAEGFTPIDEHARVVGADGLYAAGDGTAFPIKQGGLGTQQADAAAEHIAMRMGFRDSCLPFRPVLRGKLLTGAESLNLRSEVAGGAGDSQASPDALWWPPHKVSGRYLAPWLARESLHTDVPPPGRTVDIDIALPQEWHSEPMALDPLSPSERD
jgi:sulfide:quinone oxidoreductase